MNNNIDRAKIIFICIVAAFIIFVISLASTYIKYEKKKSELEKMDSTYAVVVKSDAEKHHVSFRDTSLRYRDTIYKYTFWVNYEVDGKKYENVKLQVILPKSRGDLYRRALYEVKYDPDNPVKIASDKQLEIYKIMMRGRIGRIIIFGILIVGIYRKRRERFV
ncbi:MAG: hypothetical protein PUD71_08565 [Lachnospiraceae bacterium]|nr:hypothetical protein [Lachnospiraceae bacterium]MDD6858406.1 hypothetical protein [Lachnospiraceae bacterium]